LTPNAETPPPAASTVSDKEKQKEPSWRKQLLIGAALALIGAVIGRAVGVIPNPFSDGGQEPSGDIEIGQTLHETLAKFLGTKEVPSEQPGLAIAVKRTSEHTSPHGCRIVWSYIDASVHTTVDEKSLVNQTAREVAGDPTACQGGASTWVPEEPPLEKYEVVRVRVEFFAGNKPLGTPAEEDVTVG
jgi:hypothetical protein